MAGGGGNKNIFQKCSDLSRQILYFQALHGHSGRNLIDPSLQDNVLSPDDSVINSGLILGAQNSSKNRQCSFCL